jgi:hypothetical protein
MGSYPYGPHGPQCSPHDVMPNPTAPSAPVPDFGGSDYPTAPSYSGGATPQFGGSGSTAGTYTGGGGAGGGFIVKFVVSLIMVVLLWIPIVCLYPLTFLSGIAAGFFTASVLAANVLTSVADKDVASFAGVIIGLTVVLIMIRIEYRLSQVAAFRVSRHVVRMVLLSFWAIPMILMAQGDGQGTTATRFIFAVVSNPRAIVWFLSRAQNVGILAVVVVGLHFLLWKGERFRRFWHRRLSNVGLK